MKRFAFPFLLILLFPGSYSITSLGQEQQSGCQFEITGTWQSSTNDPMNPTRLRFSRNGMMTELSRKGSGKGSAWQATGKSTYKLDNAKVPQTMVVTPLDKSGGASAGATLRVKTFDDGLLVTAPSEDKGAPLTRWTRVDPQRYFVVLAAGKGETGFGGPGFAMLMKTDGVHTHTDAFGVYPVVDPLQRYPVIGVIPEKVRAQFQNEPLGDSGAMLRLEVTAGPYNRALEVLKTWERRTDENALPYNQPYLNNAVYLNQLTSSLNETGVLTWRGGTTCSETIKLQKLTWRLNDQIMTKHNLTQTPYYLFKTLRELNGPLHLDDNKFRAALAGDRSDTVAISRR
jgi:hypothetical protein